MSEFNQTVIEKLFDVTRVITLFETSLLPNRVLDNEIYDFWEMLYIIDGDRTFKIGDSEHRCLSGQVLFYPPNITHQIVRDDNKSCHIALISFVCPSRAMNYFFNKVITLNPMDKKLLEDTFNLGCPLFKWFEAECSQRGMHKTDGVSEAQLYKLKLYFEMFLASIYSDHHSAVELISNETSRKRNQSMEIFRLAIHYMKEHLSGTLDAEKVSKACGISVSALKRIFREETGRGIIAYYNDLKIERAMEMIKNGVQSFSEISDCLGFSSPFYFSRVFKQKLGVSPMAYSKSIRR